MRIKKLLPGIVSLGGLIGCQGQPQAEDPYKGRFKDPVSYETLRKSQLPIFASGGLEGEVLLKRAYERGRFLVDLGGPFKGIIANGEFIFDSIRGKNLDGPTWVRTTNAMEEAEEKGVLDRMYEKGSITLERHKFLSDRLASYLWNDPIQDNYLLNLQKEKELIEKLVTGKIIDQDTQEYFNSEEWFKQFEWICHVESMFKVLTYGVENGKLDNELVATFAKSKNYDSASRIAQLYMASELTREETTGLVEKLNKKFANAVIDYPFESKSFVEYRFDASEVIPLLIHHHAEKGKTDTGKLIAAFARNEALLTKGHILGGWMSDVKETFSDLGLNYYDVLGLNKKDPASRDNS